MWLKYNDTKVEEVKDTNEIFRRPSDVEFRQWNGPSNPYYLVYVRDEDKDKLVESVCRDMQQLPQPENNDIAMKDMPDTGNATDDGTDWVNNAQSEHSSVSVPLVLREKGVNPSGEWDRSEANTHTKW